MSDKCAITVTSCLSSNGGGALCGLSRVALFAAASLTFVALSLFVTPAGGGDDIGSASVDSGFSWKI